MPRPPEYAAYENGSLLDGRYEKLSDINHGSYGVVSLAKDTKQSDCLVAIKCLLKQQQQQPISNNTATTTTPPHSIERPNNPDEEKKENLPTPDPSWVAATMKDAEFDREIHIHEIIGSHNNVVHLIDHFQTLHCSFLVLDYCQDGDLYEAIRANILNPNQFKSLMLQLIDVVEFCHSKSVYHRDIKPENILLTHDTQTVKLADWGLATTNRLSTELGIGSERYMAPELLDQNVSEYDAGQADIWSIGICLLNIVFGRNPFVTASDRDKLFLDYAFDRQALFDIFPTMSFELFQVLRHALAIDPSNRSLSAMRDALLSLSSWTTDDEEEAILSSPPPQTDDPLLLIIDDDNDLNEQQQLNDSKATKLAFTLPTEYREPLRTPSIMKTSFHAKAQDFPWDNLNQAFTPPAFISGFIDNQHVNNNKKHHKSRAKPNGSSGASTLTSIDEYDAATSISTSPSISTPSNHSTTTVLFDEPILSDNNTTTTTTKYVPPSKRGGVKSNLAQAISDLKMETNDDTQPRAKYVPPSRRHHGGEDSDHHQSKSYHNDNGFEQQRWRKKTITDNQHQQKSRSKPPSSKVPEASRWSKQLATSMPADIRHDTPKYSKPWSEVDTDDDGNLTDGHFRDSGYNIPSQKQRRQQSPSSNRVTRKGTTAPGIFIRPLGDSDLSSSQALNKPPYMNQQQHKLPDNHTPLGRHNNNNNPQSIGADPIADWVSSHWED